MTVTEEEVRDVFDRAQIITVVFFVFFALIIARQGSSVWFNMSRHPNWIPDVATLLVFLVTAVVVVFTLAPMMSTMMAASAVHLSRDSTRTDPQTSLAVVATAVITAWTASSVLFYRYSMRVAGRVASFRGSAIFRVLWIPASVIFLYAVTGGTLVWTVK